MNLPSLFQLCLLIPYSGILSQQWVQRESTSTAGCPVSIPPCRPLVSLMHIHPILFPVPRFQCGAWVCFCHTLFPHYDHSHQALSSLTPSWFPFLPAIRPFVLVIVEVNTLSILLHLIVLTLYAVSMSQPPELSYDYSQMQLGGSQRNPSPVIETPTKLRTKLKPTACDGGLVSSAQS